MKITTQHDVEAYYAQRGISAGVAQKFGASPGPDGNSIKLREGTDGTVYRLTDNEQRWKAEGKRQHTVLKGSANPAAIFVVEGVHDLMSLMECGVTDAVALYSASVTKGLPELLKSTWGECGACPVLLMLDNDQAGDHATSTLLAHPPLFFSPFALSDARHMLKGAKDANDALTGDRAGFAARIQAAITPKPQTTLQSHLASLVAYYCTDIERPKAFSTGLSALDSALRIEGGHLVLVAGRPAMGKTALAFQIALHAADTVRVVFVSLEMSARELLLRAIVKTAEGLTRDDLRDPPLAEDKRPALISACGVLGSKRLEILDDPQCKDIAKLSSNLQREHEREAIGLIVVDYVQLMGDGSNTTRERDIAEVSRGLKLLAREVDCPVIALSQLNRGVEQRQDKRPYMSDLRESGSLEQDADAVVLLYRDEYYNAESTERGIAELIIAKNRHGATSTQRVKFTPETTTFSDILKVERHGRISPF